MAHMCINLVSFKLGSKDQKSFLKEIKMMCKLSESLNEGVLPGDYKEGIDGAGDYLFFEVPSDRMIDYDDKTGSFQVSSKYSPPIDVLHFIAKKYNISMECHYEELGSYEYGVWKYDHLLKNTEEICLTEDEINLVKEFSIGYELNGEYYDSRYDALDLLLDAKIKGGELLMVGKEEIKR